MVSLLPWHLLLTFTFILMITQMYSSHDRRTYIVYMGEIPKGMNSTSLKSLHKNMAQRVLGSDFVPEGILYSYVKSFNGFVLKLTRQEAERMAEMDGVVSILPNQPSQLQTTRSWDFIGLSEHVKRTSKESDIIVGVIDSGIWPESDSFSDEGYGPPPSKWKGSCHNITCNNKIIGAKYFAIDHIFGKDDIISPRDSNGHGTHCASIIAGNSVSSASLQGLGLGTARGAVPSARIAVYKACWSPQPCDVADILAAFDEAIADGVDIISTSIGGFFPTKYLDDPIDIGAFHALKKGILTLNSAGNSGSQLYTMFRFAPWVLSVAASTIDRKFFTKVQLGNGMVYEGVSVNTFDLENKMYELIYAGDAPNITGGYNFSTSRLCSENSLDNNLVKGKIVLCDSFLDTTGLLSGAAGVLVANTDPKDAAFSYALPTTHLSLKDSILINSYMNSTSNPTATILKSNVGHDSSAPYIFSFSSRGPNPFAPDILKPDLAAPGVDILAAWSPLGSLSGLTGDKRAVHYNIISGTSMSCPHAAGAAAYIKSFHPNWSCSAIKSAMMTTASPMSPILNPEAEFAYGAGQIDPVKAVNPGLVYDASEDDYVKFMCGQGYDARKLECVSGDSSNCREGNNGSVWDLNQPSFALSATISASIGPVVYRRTVTNVGSATSTYKAKVIASHLLSIEVNPSVLSFTEMGQKKSFTVTIEGTINVPIVSASLVWDDTTVQVRSPIVVYDVSYAKQEQENATS